MSSVPGIGRNALYDVARALRLHKLDDELDDVPNRLRHAARKFPLGRYLMHNLREMVGRDEKAPEIALAKIREEMQPLYDRAVEASKAAPARVRQEIRNAYLAEYLCEKSQGWFNRLESKKVRFITGRKL